MQQNELKLLLEIAQLYYENKLTQAEIAEKLGIYRTTISRHLKKAEDLGLVTFSINYNVCETFLLEKQLREHFNLEHVFVTNNQCSDNELHKLALLGQATANHLQNIITDNSIIGFSWGRALSSVAEYCKPVSAKHVLCIPMVGGPAGHLESKHHVNTIVYNIASKLHCQSLLMDFPAILENSSLRDAILKSQHYLQFAQYWNKLDIAVFGIGSNLIQDSSVWKGFYANFVEEITHNNAVGDICSHFLNIEGQPISTKISNRLINITLDKVKLAKHRIGVAYGQEKVDAIIGAMNGNYLNTLVTTKETAQAIIDKVLSPG